MILGFQLICSPKFSECESGSTLLFLSRHWVTDQKLDLDMILELPINATLLCKAKPVQVSHSLSEFLLTLYQNLLQTANQNFFRICKECPMHGILTSLRICMPKDRDLVKGSGFLDRLVLCLEETVKFMLGKLSNQDLENASFAEMSAAIDAIIDGTDNDGDNVEISEEHQLILACSWLNLKECALLSALIVSTFDTREPEVSPEIVSKCGQILVDVLTKCRHKGAMEATSLAVKDYATTLFANENPVFSRIPETMLRKVLDQASELLQSLR